MKNKLSILYLFTVIALSALCGCSFMKQNTYELKFNYKPTDRDYDIEGKIHGAGLRDLGRDWTWVIDNLKEKLGK